MFKFSIRELLLLVTLAAVGAGWWTDRAKLHGELARQMLWKTRAGALERILTTRGWVVEYNTTWGFVEAAHPNQVEDVRYPDDFYAPTEPIPMSTEFQPLKDRLWGTTSPNPDSN